MKTVIEMAREATFLDSRDDWSSVPDEYREAVNAFAELVRAEEREACARACEEMEIVGSGEYGFLERSTIKDCVETIRARGQQ